MYALNIWNKLHLYSRKSGLIGLLWFVSIPLLAQKGGSFGQENLLNYDERLIHYGFFLGGHTSNFRLNYAEEYTNIPNLQQYWC